MSMLLIKGSFQVKGGQPDGDSVHFTADNPAEWNLVGGTHRVKHNGAGRSQLRMDAIDALETHYQVAGPRVHQPLAFAHAAADELLDWLGFTGVQRTPDETVTDATPESVPGFILTRGADIHGRCVALVGRGEHPADSGTGVFVDVVLLKTTANHHLLSAGLAYPTYYRNLFPDLRAELTSTVHQAQTAPAQGLWPSDATTTGAKITGLSSLTDDVIVLPKLFRRLVDYLKLGGGDPSLAGFPAFLAQAADRFFVLSTGHSTTGLDAVVVVNADTVRMTRPVEDLVFDEA